MPHQTSFKLSLGDKTEEYDNKAPNWSISLAGISIAAFQQQALWVQGSDSKEKKLWYTQMLAYWSGSKTW